MARDKFHYAVRRGLEKQEWQITHDPLRLELGPDDRVEIDLGAQQLLGAQRTGEKIAVEIKSFLNDSAMLDFHLALGQFLNYRLVLQRLEPERTLYLAIPITAYQSFFYRQLPQLSIQTYHIKLITYEPNDEVILQWIE
ncbi:element excision factor XisH family protein [Arthrospira platensis]|uniref:element excision factor XisH family protein n=1 Tax=Limnospira TaxID=2596745 RepID=UPI0001C38C08|nr:element excision factor XisH family protein [Arthrospira platensis]AMW29524.1 fatty-acid oxidation protein subunit alpha [Arthrospira platensis YZ]KDR56931.1 fatty-acid oxidation protein subunit alpha [Arthrospira platensis str. Paraca]MBD2669045.1 XisH family protein [Arthrospira platensis FACHB-439]MBD2709546.1 XisH family protein [Arthrospira platensis FACHB-835]MDT9181498.1 element excision factor XisH family protein [Limnospira sp. PMC 289.06]MDT9294073.1 element excision factor XisH 